MGTRSRSRGSITAFSSPQTVSSSCGTSGPYGSNWSTKYPSLIESIVDETNAKRSNYRNSVNNCSHSKTKCTHSPIEYFRCTASDKCVNDPSITRVETFHSNWYVSPLLPSTTTNPVGWESDGYWCDKNIRKMAEAVPSNVSLPNFLLEMSDITGLPRQLATAVRRLGDSLGKRSLPSLGKAIADGYLINAFGIQPFVSDVKKLLTAYEDMERRLSWLRRNNRKRVTVRRRQTGTVWFNSTTQSGTGPHGAVNSFRKRMLPCSMEVRRCLTANAYIDYTGLNAPLAEMAALRSHYGFNKPLSVIWEAVPFSWAIDYFLKVQDVIDALPHSQPFAGTTTLQGLCFSRKAFIREVRNVMESTVGLSCVCSPSEFWSGSLSTYSRSVGSSVPSSSGLQPYYSVKLTGSQITNLLAVLLQKGL